MKKIKRVTTKDIAQQAGVSKATVSYVLNGTGSVSAEVAKQVRKIAKDLGYQENRLAKATRTGTTKTIGLVLPDLCNPFFPEMAQSVVETASLSGYSVFLVDARNSIKEESLGLKRLMEYAVDGIIWCPVDDRAIAQNKVDCHTVITDRYVKGYDCVYPDSVKGGKLQAGIVNRTAHKKIGLIAGPERSHSSQDRRLGFCNGLDKNKKIEWVFSLEYALDIPSEIAEQIINSDVTCVVAANDTLAISLIRLYRNAGINVPEDVSVVGFDDISWSNLISPPLSTIKLPIREMGSTAFDMLVNRIKNPKSKKVKTVLDVSVLERDSVNLNR